MSEFRGAGSVYDEDDDDDYGFADQEDDAISVGDDPRTTSEIKRSRIDLDRRYVFLCPTSLSKHFDALPRQARDNALLVFKCSQEWFASDSRTGRKKTAQSRVECGVPKNAKKKTAPDSKAALYPATCRSNFSKEFRQWVAAKEREGSIYWWKPEKDFKKLSKFFEEKRDLFSQQLYQPLLLDPHWWRCCFHRATARYCNNPSIIIGGISQRSTEGVDKSDLPMHALQELIYQSNPTLEPIAKWPHAPSMRFLPKAAPTSNFLGQYASFKGYIEPVQRPEGSSSSRAPESRITSWPPVPRERFDDLQAAWQFDDVMARRTLPSLRSPRTAPPTLREKGGLFSLKLGFGLGSPVSARLATANPLAKR